MHFTLIYEGDLPPNGSRNTKWAIRRQLDRQIRKLWNYPPLNKIDKYRDSSYEPRTCYLGREINGIEFVSPVSEKIRTLVELRITLLSAGMGIDSLISRGGDIDNRLKTLLDALQAPQSSQEIPDGADTDIDKRVYCLMDNDKLVRLLEIGVDRLLTVDDFCNNVLVMIKVKIVAGEGTMANLGIVV